MTASASFRRSAALHPTLNPKFNLGLGFGGLGRGFGVLGFWGFGVLGFRGFGVSGFRGLGV